MQIKQSKNGFTLIEIILYVAILGILLTVVTSFSLDSIQEKNNQKIKQTTKQDADFVLHKISYEVENAGKINHSESLWGSNLYAGKLILNRKDGTLVTFFMSGSSVYFQEATNLPVSITTAGTEIIRLNFLADTTSGNVPREIQAKVEARSANENLKTNEIEEFRTAIIPKQADTDQDGCLDIVDQFPFDPTCCQDTDGDGFCDEKDLCILIHDMDQIDNDGDGLGANCDNEVDTGSSTSSSSSSSSSSGGGGAIVGGTWDGVNTKDSCIYTCNYSNNLWQTICKQFECFYTGNKNSFETDTDNDEYAGVGQVFSLDPEMMYWKKTFKIDLPQESIEKIDRVALEMNYCHGGSRLLAWWRKARCSGDGYHINGYYVGNQEIEIFNYASSTWDTMAILETHLNNNDEIYATYEYSHSLQDYINLNDEITIRVEFHANGAPWGDPQRWNFLVPSRYLFLDYLNLKVHVQGLSVCGDGNKEMDEQCDDGSHCSDGTDCTASGAVACALIGDTLCQPRDLIGNDCSATCLNENAVCGNGLREVGEQCDDNDLDDGDGCSATCTLETCGNTVPEGPEECDTGTRCDLNGATCSTDLQCAGIGDEKCLMRNGDDDYCSEFCLKEECGNARKDFGENCDDGEHCSDGVKCTGTGAVLCMGRGLTDETCAVRDGDGCNSACQLEWCGNTITDIAAGEECDDGKTCSDYSMCNTDADCLPLGASEICIIRDDDNCNNSCQIQECGDGDKNRSIEQCDNGKQCGDVDKTPCTKHEDCLGIGDGQCLPRSLDSCDANCQIEYPVCGNGGLPEFGEDCDDGNPNDGDGCSHTCMNEYIAVYDYNNPALNGLNLGREAWIVGSNTQPPNKGPYDLSATVSYGAPKPYQVEFMDLDDLIPQAPMTNYNLIKENDTNSYQAFFTESGYVNHKFDFKINDAEFSSTETLPKRIEYIEITWNGMPKWFLFDDRSLFIYVWNSNKWEKLASEKFYPFNISDKTITVKITDNINNYIDANRKLHILVGTDKKGSDMVSTDFLDVKIKAYPYRDGYE